MIILLRLIRAGAIAAAGFVVLVIAIEVSKRMLADGLGGMGMPDIAFMGVLLAMLAGFVWLSRSITRELAKNKPEP